MSSTDGDLGELLMVIGDLYIPQRTLDLPECFRELLKTDKIKRVLCTGNVGNGAAMQLLKDLSPNFDAVRGDFDPPGSFPERKVITVGNLTIGLINGYQLPVWGDQRLLYTLAIEMGVDVLIHGHTHTTQVAKYKNKIFINPASATGAFKPWQPNAVPTFLLLAVKSSSATVYVYQEQNGQANVVMSELDHDAEAYLDTPSPLQTPQKIQQKVA
ncbi:bifunctional Metallo-dependent phosphatase-like/Phosphodiesterase MJ0936-Vps29/Vacuolar protein sorting-associated protein 29/Calcineurin-like phosphoesterase domain [Babesia duncani]|uniref:Vacuolar protein sorting-associated protein 29 n=1 Tax=Babesia duncani TaxID=323732 RepID=A0AAD9PI88_9APIC|nr:bifunctional Metallo-dependent phosphatase-like/Phosphodiesterase MJ0936-Vps29/Vacuolar protein sorting-associated protein 29/Calcineurin-like phosphoesterase domain [Babesia duncani]KAK2194938.1 bifunctional Metallo-dependent phosphatase-like/Phosphodiesterase MJ0936-Vps29/Vacuolar protein sorting-associated protein 29/Calcineurin-like phosphoesterase domain [Babesia duncani]KAK2196366.1 bifunctional Metallo-dependent phosphatase-like/Phosphodiesterase MJ0936-Vps29/Vacuolar protein sorting-as